MVYLVSGNIRHVAFDPNRITEQADRGNSSKRQNPVLDWSQDRVVKKVKGKETSSMASKYICLNYIISFMFRFLDYTKLSNQILEYFTNPAIVQHSGSLWVDAVILFSGITILMMLCLLSNRMLH